MSAHATETLASAPLLEPAIRRLGERTGVVRLGPDLRHVELPVVEAALDALVQDGGRDLVFDLTSLRRYDAFALVRLAREWDRLAASGCTVHVAARDTRVVADLERLAGAPEWRLHSSPTRALRALLSAPVA